MQTPRWLLANGREEEAHAFLVRFHGNNDPNHPLVAAEWREMKEGISQNGSDKRPWDYSELFKTRNARYRITLAIMLGVFGQFSGNGLGYFNTQVSSYSTTPHSYPRVLTIKFPHIHFADLQCNRILSVRPIRAQPGQLHCCRYWGYHRRSSRG